MSILCCRRGDPRTTNKQVILPPKVLDRITTLGPQASNQKIEAFYKEGRKLLNTPQEETGKTCLQNETKEEPRNPRTSVNWEETSGGHRETEHIHGARQLSKASSAIELRESNISAIPDSHYAAVPAKSMPALKGSMVSEIIKSGSRPVQERDINHRALVPLFPGGVEVSQLPQNIPIDTDIVSRIGHVAVPSTPDLSPYLMPSIATTIASINGKSRSGVTIPASGGDLVEAGELSPGEGSDKKDVRTADEQQEDYRTVKSEIRLDGTAADNEEGATVDTDNSRDTNHQRDASVDLATSRNDFTPNELFSKIPTWVRPSTSTFMSFPSSHDCNRKDGLGSSPSTGSATPELSRSNSTRFYSPLEAASANSTGANTPAFICPPTPGYEFRPSIDNTSSFYPSPGTSRCVSLAESERHTSEPSTLSTEADTRMLNRTPRPSDMIIDSPSGSSFRFPWVNRNRNKSPEPISNKGAFTRGSSLAHLKKAQKRDCELQSSGPGPNSKSERSQDIVDNRHGEVCGGVHLGEDHIIPTLETPGSSLKALISKADWNYDNFENREVSNNGRTPVPRKKEGTTTWVRSTTRVSSLTMRQEGVKVSRIWGSPHARNPTASKGNTFSNYGKSEKRFSLKNSISLGERMWERSSIRDKNQERLRKATGSDVLSNLTSDIDTLCGAEGKNFRLKNRRSRAVIRSRSMTLRRTFTNSIAKLRGKVSFNGSSKGTIMSPSPGNKKSNKYDPYRGCNNEDNIGIQNSKMPGEGNKFNLSGSDVSSIIFRPSLPKEMFEHQSAPESSKEISTESRDTIAHGNNAQQCAESHQGVNSHHISDGQSVSGKPGFQTETEKQSIRPRPWSTIYDDCVTLPFGGDIGGGSEDAESDSDVDTQSNGPFRTGGKVEKEIWRDARESLEIMV